MEVVVVHGAREGKGHEGADLEVAGGVDGGVLAEDEVSINAFKKGQMFRLLERNFVKQDDQISRLASRSTHLLKAPARAAVSTSFTVHPAHSGLVLAFIALTASKLKIGK